MTHFLPYDRVDQTNVPNLRLEYRRQTLLEELAMIRTKRIADSKAYALPRHA